jgi:predicted Zn-dependent protease
MKLFLQILFFLFSWFTIQVSATPVFTKLALTNYEFTFSKTENVKEESVVKIGVKNFARSEIHKNSISQKNTSKVSYVFVGASRAGVR